MKLRDHPVMRCMGRASWPPSRWRSMGGNQNVFLSGEIGTLKEVWVNQEPEILAKLYVLMEFDKRLYMGIAMIGDATFARQIYELLREHLDEPIASVGDLDVGYLL